MTKESFESVVEEAALSWLEDLDYTVLYGPDITSEDSFAERVSNREVIINQRLWDNLVFLNPSIPQDALNEAFRKLSHSESSSLAANNRAFHRMFTDGVPVEYRRKDGSIAGDRVRLIDFEKPENNDFLAVNQFTVVEGQHHRRPDIVIFVNGLPLAVIELKNPADEDATIWTAFNQLQTYKQQIPSSSLLTRRLSSQTTWRPGWARSHPIRSASALENHRRRGISIRINVATGGIDKGRL